MGHRTINEDQWPTRRRKSRFTPLETSIHQPVDDPHGCGHHDPPASNDASRHHLGPTRTVGAGAPRAAGRRERLRVGVMPCLGAPGRFCDHPSGKNYSEPTPNGAARAGAPVICNSCERPMFLQVLSRVKGTQLLPWANSREIHGMFEPARKEPGVPLALTSEVQREMFSMRTRGTLIAVLLLALGFSGCNSPARRYDDSKIALITRGATTEAQIVEWFGPPTTRELSPDGSKTLTWRFERRDARRSDSPHLEVRFGPDGRVSAYNAANER